MITEYFTNLTAVMQADFGAADKPLKQDELLKRFSERFLTPLLPSTIRHGPGSVMDVMERQAGPFDVVAASSLWPAIGHGGASIYLSDAAIFCLSARNWAAHDLTEFAAGAKDLKLLKRKSTFPALAIAFSYTPLETYEVTEFLKSGAGSPIDAIFSLGKGLVVRNNLGWYGDPKVVPFVSETVPGPALKFFAFYLLQAVHVTFGVPFGLADYQHL